LANLFLAEEAGSSLLGVVAIDALLTGGLESGIDADPNCLPGDVWLRMIKTLTCA
jgi:hypothetical protein